MLRSFSRKPLGSLHFDRSLRVLSGSTGLADLPTSPISTPFNELFRQFADLSSLRPSIALYASTGILTSCPSVPPFGLSLGPD